MNSVIGFIILILLIATPLAFLTSIGLLWFYRRAVFRVMRRRSKAVTPSNSSQENATLPDEPVQTELNTVVLDPDSSATLQSTPKES